ncbi:MAG: S8 family peptidase [Pseudomonadota bacterium]
MRRALLPILAAALVGAAPADAAPLVPRELASLSRSSHALVRLDGARGEAAVRRAGGTLVSRRLGIWRLRSAAAQRLVPRLAVSGALLEVERELPRSRTGHLDEGDPLLSEEWWLDAIGATRVEPPTGPGKPITLVDSGVDLSHPEFAGRPSTRALNGQSVAGNDEFHGTAVASVAAAPANGVGLVGVYPAALLQTWDASPSGQLKSTDVILGIEAAAANGPGVINLSVGGTTRSSLEELAVYDAVARGSVVVAASGNERESGDPPTYPASLPHVITVGAVDRDGAVTSFSSSSPGMDVVAPGEEIVAAIPTSFAASGYGFVDGTSFASPIAAAALAWVWTVRSDLDASQAAELLRRSARDLGTPGRDDDSGFGLVDLPAALAAPAPPRDSAEPNDSIALVRGDGVLHRATAPLTTAARQRAAVTARLDAADDPRDVYRVWVPAGRRVVVTLRSADTGVTTRLLGTAHKGVRAVATRTGVELRNAGRAGRELYLAASLGRGTASYALTLTTSRLPR